MVFDLEIGKTRGEVCLVEPEWGGDSYQLWCMLKDCFPDLQIGVGMYDTFNNCVFFKKG